MIRFNEKEITGRLTDYNNNNANQAFSAGSLEYDLFEDVSKKYMNRYYKETFPEFYEAKQKGIIYNHDAAQELFKGINCFCHDPRFILRKGVRAYGDNDIGVSAGPAKHLSTALEHLAQTMGLATSYMAGGQAVAMFNYALAPYAEGLSDKELYQAIQQFMFQMNESYKNRGSQSMFSSIDILLECPEWLENKLAVGPGGVYLDRTYGSYKETAKKIAHTITEVSFNGDYDKKPLFFPNLIYNIDGADLSEWEDVFDLSAKFALPYFSVPSNNGVEYATVMGCRTTLPQNWTGDPETDCMGTGNAVYTTICLPILALYAEQEGKDFFEELDKYMDIVREYNLRRLEWIEKLWYEYHTADFLIQELDGKPMYRLEDATIVCGYLGLSECCEILYGKPLHECNEQARSIMLHMRHRVDEYKIQDGLRWGLFQTPAENCTHTLAKIAVKDFGFKKSYARGTATAPYYTNSNHVRVDADISIIERVKIEGNNQPIGSAGNIMNIYTSEAYSNPVALSKLVGRIRDLTKAYFYAITGEFSICTNCRTTYNGNVEVCSLCGGECDTFSRITGYVTNVRRTWNKGKLSEFSERKRY